MNLNIDAVIKAVKAALEEQNITTIKGVKADDLVKPLSESILKHLMASVNVQDIGEGLFKGLKDKLGK